MERNGYQPQAAFFQAAGSSATLVGSLVLLAASYLLLVAAPAVSQSFHSLSGSLIRPAELATWVPTAAGAGLAVGGAAGFVFVLERLLRNLRHHPYACIAPTLAVFSGALLVSLGAKLPLASASPEVLAIFALFLSVLGGAVIEQSRHVVLGFSIALFPSLCLLLACFSLSPQRALSAAIWGLEPSGRLFLAILGLSSVSLALLGNFVRASAPSGAAWPSQESAPQAPSQARASAREDTLELWLHQAEGQLKRRGIPSWLWLTALPLLVGGALLARDQWTGSAQVRSSGLTVSQLEEPREARSLLEAPAAAAREQAQQDVLLPQVEQLGVAQEPARATLLDTVQVEAAGLAREQNIEVEPVAPAPLVEARGTDLEQALVPEPARAIDAAQPAPQAEQPSVRKAAHARPAARVSPKAKLTGKARLEAREQSMAPADAYLAREAKADAQQPVAKVEAPGVARAQSPEASSVAAQAPTATMGAGDSLEDLMERVVPKGKQGKQARASSVAAQEDPIYGL